MSSLFLDTPHPKYKESFERFVRAYQATHDEDSFRKYQAALVDFQAYLEFLSKGALKVDADKEWIYTSTFWLINDNEVCGVVRIRHAHVELAGHIGYDISPSYRKQGYGYAILRLALPLAKSLGLNKVALFCTTDNIASKKVIERNGGVLLETVYNEPKDEYLHAYEITIESA